MNDLRFLFAKVLKIIPHSYLNFRQFNWHVDPNAISRIIKKVRYASIKATNRNGDEKLPLGKRTILTKLYNALK